MKKLIITSLIAITLSLTGCLTSGQKVTLTDTETGNSLTVSEEGVELDVNASVEYDGVMVEVE